MGSEGLFDGKDETEEENLEERRRFELLVRCRTPVFKTGAIDHSATSPGT